MREAKDCLRSYLTFTITIGLISRWETGHLKKFITALMKKLTALFCGRWEPDNRLCSNCQRYAFTRIRAG